MSALTLFKVEGASRSEMKPRVPKIAVDITIGCLLTVEGEKMFARYVISLSKFKWQ